MKDKKKKKARYAENPKGRSRKKLGPKKRKEKKRILQDESLEE